MRIEIFQSDKGDCLLLEGADGTLFLCDGGMRDSMKDHVRGALARLRTQDRPIEFAYISHIDQDHISGVLQLLEDEAAWRVFEHHRAAGDDAVRPPRVPRPPEIRGILHNAFRDQVTKNRGAIRNLLAATAPSLLATAVPDLTRAALEMEAIATSIPEALRVSRLASPEALDIPINRPPGSTGPARLMFVGQPPAAFDVGSMRFTVVGPGADELDKLRDGWQNWLRANKETVKKLRAELKRRIDEFSQSALTGEPFDLRDWNGIPDHKGVTVPNIASLMFLVEENGRRLLLTGDSQQDFILRGLRTAGLLDDGHVHLDVLKVQHHGSENNLDAEFARTVSADHYVFCGNGEHGNPEPAVLDHVFDSRLGAPELRARSPRAAGRDFHFWFSTTAQAQPAGSEARR
jgi:beta-lactamase superfamily II metal-dependent hydrolase